MSIVNQLPGRFRGVSAAAFLQSATPSELHEVLKIIETAALCKLEEISIYDVRIDTDNQDDMTLPGSCVHADTLYNHIDCTVSPTMSMLDWTDDLYEQLLVNWMKFYVNDLLGSLDSSGLYVYKDHFDFEAYMEMAKWIPMPQLTLWMSSDIWNDIVADERFRPIYANSDALQKLAHSHLGNLIEPFTKQLCHLRSHVYTLRNYQYRLPKYSSLVVVNNAAKLDIRTSLDINHASHNGVFTMTSKHHYISSVKSDNIWRIKKAEQQ